MRLFSSIINDIKIQFRSGFYYAYLFVCAIYVTAVFQLPDSFRSYGVFYVIFTDPTVLGFYFIGGLILLERRQKTVTSLFVTPLRLNEYLASKVVSLGLLGLISSLLIAIILLGGNFNIPVFSLTVILASAIFTLTGVTLGVQAQNINSYLFISPLYLLPIVLPVLGFLGIVSKNLFFFIPTHSILNLLNYSILDIKRSSLWIDFSLLIVWTGIAFCWAKSWFTKFIINQTGE
ncbi:MAG: ABC transporter permease [Candidatus Marinimicrobia bacterium]|nr:ABC transporter permease [Candidatus Neomarinimicrobiota bacterium]